MEFELMVDLTMAGKFFTLPKILIISVAIIIVVVSVVWFSSQNTPSISPSPSPTPTAPSNLPTQTATSTPNPSPTAVSSSTPNPSTPKPTSQTSNTPPPTSNPTPTPTLSPTPTPTALPTTIVFNFDNATPTLSPRQPTPLYQTSNGLTASFSSPFETPSKPEFSVQNVNSLASISTVINSANFSGLFLWPSTINRASLDINFSNNITRITFNFKTAELHDPGPGGTGSPIKLSAYLNSFSNPIGSELTVNGIETPFDNYPEGTLTFYANGQRFNNVEISLPYISAQGATGFIIDNITVTTT